MPQTLKAVCQALEQYQWEMDDNCFSLKNHINSVRFKKSEALHKMGAGPFSLCDDSMYPPQCATRNPFKLSGHFDIWMLPETKILLEQI